MCAPDASQLKPGQVWQTPDGKRLTINGIEGTSVDCSRHDPTTLVTDVYVGKRDEFGAYTLISSG